MEHKADKLITDYENFFHDIKTILTITFSHIQALERIADMPARSSVYISDMKKNWYRMAKLIFDANDSRSISSGLFMPKLKNVNIIEILREATETTKAFADRKNISLSFCSDTQIKIMAADKAVIERIMLNLLSNAIKYTGRDGAVDVLVFDKGEQISIAVRDNGGGMSKETLGQLFSRSGNDGSGLGLSIVKEFTELLNGTLAIKSGEDGTEINVTLPVFISEQEHDELLIDDFYSDKIVQIELSDDY